MGNLRKCALILRVSIIISLTSKSSSPCSITSTSSSTTSTSSSTTSTSSTSTSSTTSSSSSSSCPPSSSSSSLPSSSSPYSASSWSCSSDHRLRWWAYIVLLLLILSRLQKYSVFNGSSNLRTAQLNSVDLSFRRGELLHYSVAHCFQWVLSPFLFITQVGLVQSLHLLLHLDQILSGSLSFTFLVLSKLVNSSNHIIFYFLHYCFELLN